MFGADKVGDTMTVAMTSDDAENFFGIVPPDLSVMARSRGANWLYTYFMTFYRDPFRPFGVNNLVFKDVAMRMSLGVTGLAGCGICRRDG